MCQNTEYTPHSLDISLPPELDDVLELIAEGIHDAWAHQRLKDGWRLGPHKSDLEKTTPLLVPYETLPEEEKEYDRITARQTILQLLSHGYRIIRD